MEQEQATEDLAEDSTTRTMVRWSLVRAALKPAELHQMKNSLRVAAEQFENDARMFAGASAFDASHGRLADNFRDQAALTRTMLAMLES